MAFLTFIYVIATILILLSNSKGTRIMKENLLLTDKIQKENAKLALHTKRLDAFDRLDQLVIKIYDEGPKKSYIDELLKTCKTVYYLFDDSIDTQVKKIVFDIQRLRRIEPEHRNFAKTRKEKTALDKHENVLHESILENLKLLTDQVNEYLDIGNLGMDIEEEGSEETEASSEKEHETQKPSE